MLTFVASATMIILAQAAAPAASATSATPNSKVAPSTARANADDKMVCQSEMQTGTMFSHRTCHTVAEWRQISHDAQQQMGDYEHMHMQGATPKPGT